MVCQTPTWIKFKQPKRVGKGWQYAWPSGCGKCLICLKKRKNQWSYRLMEEKNNSFSSYFVTLTYKEEYVPIGDNGYCANKNDHTEFIKWLNYYETTQKLSERKKISAEELQRENSGVHEIGHLRYFGVIEYGDINSRPHWHYLLFNVVDIDNIGRAWSKQVCVSEKGYHKAAEYEPGDTIGRIDIDECNVNTVDYVVKYMMKHEQEKNNDDREAERSFMSKGIGQSAATPEFLRHISAPDHNQVCNARGIKVPLPRYYKKKYLSEDQLEAKQKYTARMAMETEEKKQAEILRQKRDPEKVRISGINARVDILKNRQKRNSC